MVLLLDGDEVLAVRTVVDGFFVTFGNFIRGLAVELFEVSQDSLPPLFNIFVCGSSELINRPFSLKSGSLFGAFLKQFTRLLEQLILLYDLLEGGGFF